MGLAAAGIAIVLAIALVIKAIDWPVSFTGFLAWAGAAILLLAAAFFSFWAYACYRMRYVLDRGGITVSWGLIKHFIAIDEVRKLVPGRGEQRPRVRGLSWYGYHVGRGSVEGIGDALFFSTHTSPEGLVYVMTSGATYALSPRDPVRFIAQAQRLQEAAQPERKSGVERDFLSSHPVFADRTAQLIALAAIALNVALWGFLMAVYPDLDREITIEFPPVGDITGFHERSEILKIPAAATAILAANLLVGLAFEWKERAATYLLLSGAVFFQAAFWVAAVVALLNA